MEKQLSEAVRGSQSDFMIAGSKTIDESSKNRNMGDIESIPDAALAYSAIGLRVFTLSKNGKVTITGTNGSKDATADPAEIRQMFAKNPGSNLAIATGYGLAVIDLDRGHSEGVDGVENFREWQEENGHFPDTWTACTPTGGVHIFLKTKMNVHNFQENSQHPLPQELKGIDVRGVGGYVVAAPSSINGSKYFWDVAPDETALASDDELLSKLIHDLTPQEREKKESSSEQELKIGEGSRNGTLTSYAGKLQHEGLPDDVIESALLQLNRAYCRPPLKDSEVKKIVKSVSRYDKGDFKTADTPSSAFKAYSLNDYILEGQFDSDISYFRKYKDRKTGFSNIDKNLTLYPGLAALGGQSSIGKTSFCVNLADNLVKAGETVLYFSLEQEPIEIATKSLTRRLDESDPFNKLTNTNIKDGATSSALEKVKKEYAADIGDRFIVVRCDFTITAASIRDYVEDYIKRTGRRPVVIIDYLQLISPPADFKGDARAAIDMAIKTFKTMQIANELLVILVSNFNRSSYDTPASFDDFKESGMIEYTCDYVWALQLSIQATDRFYRRIGKQGGIRETTKKEKSDMVHCEMNMYPKHVEFVSLKSRNGRQSYRAFFDYYMDKDRFTEDTTALYDDDAVLKNGEAALEADNFQQIADDAVSPFDDVFAGMKSQ